jgi:hypothetical protein
MRIQTSFLVQRECLAAHGTVCHAIERLRKGKCFEEEREEVAHSGAGALGEMRLNVWVAPLSARRYV